MTPEASSRRTRSSDARGESPTACASFWMVERPSRWSAARILTSMRSNAGGRLAAIDVCFPLDVGQFVGRAWAAARARYHTSRCRPRESGDLYSRGGGYGSPLSRGRQYMSLCVGSRDIASLERLVLDRHGVVEREPAAVGVDRFPGDIACLRRSEEDGNRRDLVGLADAPERRA